MASANDVGSTIVISALQNPSFEPEALTITSPNGRDAFTFEIRGVYATDYDEVDFPGRVLFGWYSALNEAGQPATLLALTPPRIAHTDLRFNPRLTPFLPRVPGASLPPAAPTIPREGVGQVRVATRFDRGIVTPRLLIAARGTDRGVFTLGPIGDCVLDPLSNESRGAVKDLGNGEFELRWADGGTTTFRTQTRARFRVAISWDHGNGSQRNCTM